MLSVLLTPLLITCLAVFAALIFCVRNYDLSQSICIRYTLQAQHKMQKHLEHLLKLNSKADTLRKSYKKTYKIYKIAKLSKNALVLASIKARLIWLHTQRIHLSIKQKTILAKGKLDLQKAWLTFKKELKKLHPQWIKKYTPHPSPLAVKSKPKGDIAPSYYIPSNFIKKQKLSFSWGMPIYQFLPSVLRKLFFNQHISLFTCSATLYPKGNKWIAGLIK